MMKVAVYSTKKFEQVYLERSNHHKHELIFIDEALSLDTANKSTGCDAISIFTNDDASAIVLEKLADLKIKYIAIRAAGFDQTDLRKAAELNFHVANVPEYSPYSIAEHTIAMIQALNRKLIIADRQVKAYNFSLDNLIGYDLHGKTVGIVGLGKIGGIVAKILQGFGCNILGYDVKENVEYSSRYGVKYVSMEELCKRSDIISLHAPLNEHTKYMINKQSITLMKEGVMIINTGRGGLIDTSAAIEGLKSGKIGYMGLDVYEKEKGLYFYDHSSDIPHDELFAALLKFDQVLITGHQAFLTENALTNIADGTIHHFDCWSRGIDTSNELIKS